MHLSALLDALPAELRGTGREPNAVDHAARETRASLGTLVESHVVQIERADL